LASLGEDGRVVDVALVSVVSSAAVAVVVTAAQIVTAAADRRIQLRMKRDELTWAARTSALQGTADVAVRLRRLLHADLLGVESAALSEDLHAALLALNDQLGMVAMYATDAVSTALDNVLFGIRGLRPGSADLWRDIDRVRREKELAIDAGDFEVAAQRRADEVQLLRRLGLPDAPEGLQALRRALDRLISAIRSEVASI
jgi:hypothetical protein